MPIINIKMAEPMPSVEKREKIAQEITNLMANELGKNKDRIVVMFEVLKSDEIFFGGSSVKELSGKK